MADTDADTYLRNLKARLDALPIAPDPNHHDAGFAVERRVDEWHTCNRCGALAMVAYITHTAPPRWLDLCAEDARWLGANATPEARLLNPELGD